MTTEIDARQVLCDLSVLPVGSYIRIRVAYDTDPGLEFGAGRPDHRDYEVIGNGSKRCLLLQTNRQTGYHLLCGSTALTLGKELTENDVFGLMLVKDCQMVMVVSEAILAFGSRSRTDLPRPTVHVSTQLLSLPGRITSVRLFQSWKAMNRSR
jgi:hypothetical protein